MDSDNKQRSSTIQSEALQRLRDRTDELELIISSLTIFALFSIPGWLLESFSNIYTHLAESLLITGTIGISLIAGVSYALASCFIVHLMTRAYWVGLIGLRTVFPEGINWEKTPGIGPITRKRFKATLPDLDAAIERTDRLASSLFAIIGLITMSMLWIGLIMVITMLIAVQIGVRIGHTNASINIATVVLVVVLTGPPLLLWLLDAQLAKRIPRLQNSRFFVGIIKVLGRLTGLVFPQRLILPVQLTLQSNTRPTVFFLVFSVGILAIVLVGTARFASWQNFSLSNEFTYYDTTEASGGFRSTYYEDMNSPKDRIRAWPRIDSFEQKGRFVTVFLPYQPVRDNLMLEKLCPDTDELDSRTDCLRKLWSVTINDQPVPMASFKLAERMDLRMRGLIGLVPLRQLSPGMHHIEILWNPTVSPEDQLIDDRYSSNSREFRIPIAFMPDYEITLQNAE